MGWNSLWEIASSPVQRESQQLHYCGGRKCCRCLEKVSEMRWPSHVSQNLIFLPLRSKKPAFSMNYGHKSKYVSRLLFHAVCLTLWWTKDFSKRNSRLIIFSIRSFPPCWQCHFNKTSIMAFQVLYPKTPILPILGNLSHLTRQKEFFCLFRSIRNIFTIYQFALRLRTQSISTR